MTKILNTPADLVESFSGVRGIFGQGITQDIAFRYALAYCQLWPQKPKVLVVAGDSRPSTPSLKQAMIKAFLASGVFQVIDLDIVPVQVAEYVIQKWQADGGVYVSASHNEPQYNGWKMLKPDGAILYPNQADRVIALVHDLSWQPVIELNKDITGQVVNKQQQAIDLYISYVLNRVGPEAVEKIKKSSFNVLIDPNGGAGLLVLQPLLAALGVKATIINNQLGQFSRLIEPKAESLAFLIQIMSQGQFQFACGFDCDADRVEFVLSPNGSWTKKMGSAMLSGQYVLALACDSLLSGTKNQVVVTNDATSYLIRDVIKRHNAVMKEVEVGEIVAVEAMEAESSLIGGEGSNGGVIIPTIKCRDGLMTMVLMLKTMAQSGQTLEAVLESYPQYFSARTKVSCLPEKAIAIREKLEDYFKSKGYQILKTGDETGGLKALLDPNSYVWFRQSKTELGVFRIHAEADQSQQKADNLLQEGNIAFNRSQ
jgi:phosphomannomutase